MNTTPETKLAETHLAHYHIVREAGRGAMSTVYEAIDERTAHTVALKVLLAPTSLPPAQQRSLIARLGREARLIARLSHPNIVRILDVGEDQGRHYIAMEYLHGMTLRERLDTGPIPLAEASLVLDQVAAALDAIHPQRIVHRDIKPSNVMLLPDGHVKLMDFGVARQGDDTTITQTGMIVGSPAYMSPEQIRGEEGTPASDLWALGVLLYEMLAARSPFPGPNIPAVLYKVTHDPPAPLPGIPPAIQQSLRRALEKKPGRRYRTAREFADAVRTTLVRHPSPQRPLTQFAPSRWPGGWLRIALPVTGFLAVIAGLLFLILGPGHRRASAPLTVPPLPAVARAYPDARPTPSPAAVQRPLRHLKSISRPTKPLPHRKFKAHHQLSHAEQAWANHLRRAAKRAVHRQHHHSAPTRPHPFLRPHRVYHAVILRSAPPVSQSQMPAHPVYNPAGPAD